jgi:hypothetical protein
MPKKKSKDSEDQKTAPQVNDIAKPGETPSSPTSRPIITGHGPILQQDPMVAGKADDEKVETKDESGINPVSTEITIQPDAKPDEKPEQEDKAEEPETPVETPAKEPETEASSQQHDEATENQKDESVKDEEQAPNSDSAAIDSVASSAEAKKLDAKKAEEEQKKTEQIQQLKNDKKYYVPIVEGGHRASSQRLVSWLFLILLLAAVLIYLLIDSGHLDVGVSLPFDLIKN